MLMNRESGTERKAEMANWYFMSEGQGGVSVSSCRRNARRFLIIAIIRLCCIRTLFGHVAISTHLFRA